MQVVYLKTFLVKQSFNTGEHVILIGLYCLKKHMLFILLYSPFVLVLNIIIILGIATCYKNPLDYLLPLLSWLALKNPELQWYKQ